MIRRLSKDASAALSVFVVALPLCLGIAKASGAPALSGIISGVIGGILVGVLSRSPLSVSGPSAGLTAVILSSIGTLGSFAHVLGATIFAGVIQIAIGFARGGNITRFFPSSVIKGVLAAIGLLLIFKQVPHLVGYDIEAFGVEEFIETPADLMNDYTEGQEQESNTLTIIFHALKHVHPGAAVIGIISLLLIGAFEFGSRKRGAGSKLTLVPTTAIVVLLGALLGKWLPEFWPSFGLSHHHLVHLPKFTDLSEVVSLDIPSFFELFTNQAFYWAAISIAFVASLETLFALEVTERLDSKQRRTPPNRELVAQGIGNVMSGILGGLPVASVVARNSVNIVAGAQSKLSTIAHGVLLALVLVIQPDLLGHIPFAALAAVLIVVGIKLAAPLFILELKHLKAAHLVPLAATALGILFYNFVFGTIFGFIIAALFIARDSFFGTNLTLENQGRRKKLMLRDDITFLHKGRMAELLESLPSDCVFEIDATRTRYIDQDILDQIRRFTVIGPTRGIEVIVSGIAGIDAYSEDVLKSMEQEYKKLLLNNKDWVDERLAQDPEFFVKQSEGQTPHFLFIGCSDSRVPVNVITKSDPGDIFVHRNIANIVSLTDINMLSVLQYSVEVLNVRHIIVVGHYGCGGVRAALSHKSLGLIDNWISQIKMVVKLYDDELKHITDPAARERRTIELHVLQQARNLMKTSIVQIAQKNHKFPFVHAWVYDLESGLINDLKAELNIDKDFNPVFKFD